MLNVKFWKVHPWVNLQSMLEKCLVGNLVPNQADEDDQKKIDIKRKSLNNLNKKPSLENVVVQPAISKEIPVLDSYQTIETVHIVLYTKCKNLKADCLTIDKLDEKNPNNIVLFVYTTNDVYKYDLGN